MISSLHEDAADINEREESEHLPQILPLQMAKDLTIEALKPHSKVRLLNPPHHEVSRKMTNYHRKLALISFTGTVAALAIAKDNLMGTSLILMLGLPANAIVILPLIAVEQGLSMQGVDVSLVNGREHIIVSIGFGLQIFIFGLLYRGQKKKKLTAPPH